MSAWDLDRARKIAGLPPLPPQQPLIESKQLNEYGGDDDNDFDDEDPDVRIADEDKGQKTFEKKNKKELKAADKESKELKKKPAAKKEEPKKAAPAEAKKDDDSEVKKKTDDFWAKANKKEDAKRAKKDPKAAPAEAKKEEPKKEEAKKAEPAATTKKEEPAKEASAEAKRRGKAPSDDSKQGKARSWLTSTAGHTRGAFIKHATANLGMSPHHANAFYYAHKKKSATPSSQEVKEAWVLLHPHLTGFMLAENREMNQMQWVEPTSAIEPMIFESEVEAKRIQKYMSEWKGQSSVVQHVSLEDDAE